MNMKNSIMSFFKKSNLSFIKSIPFNNIVFDERAKYLCKFGCKNYGKKYSCPPYSLSEFNKIKKNNYKWAILFATSYLFNGEYSNFKIRSLIREKEYEIQRISQQLKNLINFNGNKNIVFSGGSCKRCRPCSCINSERCKKPLSKQISMEAIQIDCIKTLTQAGFDFQLTDPHTLNRCGCIFTNDINMAEICLVKKTSNQVFRQASLNEIDKSCSRFLKENPNLISFIKIISTNDLKVKIPICKEDCKYFGKNFSCPPYSKRIDLKMWKNAILWRWKDNKFKKYRYNIALKEIHKMIYSLGYYFSLSIRDCYCNECESCSYNVLNGNVCQNRKILSPSMQSQGIDISQFGEGKYGLELF